MPRMDEKEIKQTTVDICEFDGKVSVRVEGNINKTLLSIILHGVAEDIIDDNKL